MQTIQNDVKAEIIIRKSRFISYLFFVSSKKEIDEKLQNLQNEYKDATHICYAYILEKEQRCEDNGEPSGTAGMPILSLLLQKKLSHVLCVVIRYFGGIKLGTGGLIRAYRESAKESLAFTEVINMKKGYQIKLLFPFENKKKVDSILLKEEIKHIEFMDQIIYSVILDEKEFELKMKNLEKLCKLMNIEKTVIKETKTSF